MAICVLLETFIVILLLSAGNIRVSSVSILTRLRDEQKNKHGFNSGKVKIFCSSRRVYNGSVFHPASSSSSNRGYYPEFRRACG